MPLKLQAQDAVTHMKGTSIHRRSQVLISALMSLTLFPRLDGLTQKMLLISATIEQPKQTLAMLGARPGIVLDIASRNEELAATDNLTPVLLSFDTMRKQHPQARC